MSSPIEVILSTRTVGQNFGVVGIVKSAKTGEVLAEANTTRPSGFDSSALDDVRRLSAREGWKVLGDHGLRAGDSVRGPLGKGRVHSSALDQITVAWEIGKASVVHVNELTRL